MSTPTALYRLFGDEDALLYIGIAKTFGRRWHQHAQTQPWWPEVRRQTIDWHPSRDAAEDAEKAAIKAEHPKYNVVHNKPPRPAAKPRRLRLAPAPPAASVAAAAPAPAAMPVFPHHEVAFSLGLRKAEVGRLPVTLGITEAAAIVGMGLTRARELARSGEFPCRVLALGKTKTEYRVTTHELLTTPGLTFKAAKLRACLVTRDAA